jgi:hypothetical protein
LSTSDIRISLAGKAEQPEMNQTLELLHDGGVGYLPECKGDGWIQLMFKNWNSIGAFTHSWKVDCLKYLIKKSKIDIVNGCETQCDWRFMKEHTQFLKHHRPRHYHERNSLTQHQ